MEKHCLALVYATQKFRHYFLAHSVHLMTKLDPIRFLIKRPILFGRLTRWALILAEFEITPILPKAIRSQALADLLALLPSENHEPIDDGLPGEFPEVAMCEEVRPWVLYFDGSPSQPEGEYEALVLGRSIAIEMGVQHILIKGDSNLVVKQGIKFQHVPRAENKQADALASFGAKVQLGEDQAKTITTIKRTQPHSVLDISCYVMEEDDWRRSIIQKLMSPKTSDLATLKEFYLRDNQLYKKSSDGLLMRCVSHEEGKDKLIELHESMCGLEGPCLYRRMQRVGLYWPTMKENCDQFQANCLECQEQFERADVEVLMKEVYQGVCGEHQGARKLYEELMRLGYYWPTMEADALRFWVEAVTLKRATGESVATFIKENILCRFGLPKRILSDNGTPFVNRIVANMLAQFDIIHDRSSPYYPKGNGQAEATNKSLLRILSRMVQDSPHDWSEYLPLTLWAYRTSKRGPTQETPFSLVYGADAILPAEITVPSARVVLEGYIEHSREADLEFLEERRDKACVNHLVYQRKMIQA
ncbi:reverse transcriptase [Senna tora]|uniref:Reverse transcriptase n=1 Tax=Senna tora TaxID=362788 RepID=A0A834WAM2_9FABA|nr:reverse transcriptase [Senna tora]